MSIFKISYSHPEYVIPLSKDGSLAIIPRPRGGEWLLEDLHSLNRHGKLVIVSALTSMEERELELEQEEKICKELGAEHLSFPINDRHVPDSRVAFGRFVRLLHCYIENGSHVKIHCRMGIGRSSLLAAGVVIAAGYPSLRAWELVEEGRLRPVPDTEEQRQWLINTASLIASS